MVQFSCFFCLFTLLICVPFCIIFHCSKWLHFILVQSSDEFWTKFTQHFFGSPFAHFWKSFGWMDFSFGEKDFTSLRIISNDTSCYLTINMVLKDFDFSKWFPLVPEFGLHFQKRTSCFVKITSTCQKDVKPLVWKDFFFHSEVLSSDFNGNEVFPKGLHSNWKSKLPSLVTDVTFQTIARVRLNHTSLVTFGVTVFIYNGPFFQQWPNSPSLHLKKT